MEPIFYALASVLLVSLVSLVGLFTLSLKKLALEEMLHSFIAFAAGTLLAAAFLDLIPEALETLGESAVKFIFLGVLVFWAIEKFIHWHHCGKSECHIHPVGYLNLIGDGIHNFGDGAIIAAAYMTSFQLGVVTTLAVIAHEIPQEIGDFAVLLHSGLSRRKALMLNFASAAAALLGLAFAYFASGLLENFEPLMLAFAAGGFIYIALTDLIPDLHRECDKKRQLEHTIAFIAGIALLFFLTSFLPAV